jgi:YD repeat-containing protein
MAAGTFGATAAARIPAQALAAAVLPLRRALGQRWRVPVVPTFVRRATAAALVVLLHIAPTPTPTANADSTVSLFDGRYTYSYTDFTLFAPPLGTIPETSLAFTRIYSSTYVPPGEPLGPLGAARGWPLGTGWTHSYNIRITADPTSEDMWLWGPTGNVDRFRRQPDGSYETPPGLTLRLARRESGELVATHQEGGSWVFARSGRLSSILTRAGNVSVLTYDAEGRLARITDPIHRGALQLEYDPATGQLAQIADWLTPPRVLQFGYDAHGRLIQVTNRTGHATRYEYEAPTPDRGHLLTRITDARGHHAMTLRYDGARRVAERWDARMLQTGVGKTLRIEDLPDGRRLSTETSPASPYPGGWRHESRAVHLTQPARIVERVERPAPDEAYVSRFVYEGNTRRMEGADGPGPLTWREQAALWEAASCPAPVQAPRPGANARALARGFALQPAEAEAVRYDDVGRLRELVAPDARGAGPPVHLRFSYDAEDRVVSVEAQPLAGGDAARTTLRYDAVGNAIVLTDFDGQVTRFDYDERDGVRQVTRSALPWTDPDAPPPAPQVETYDYDDRGHLQRMTRTDAGQVIERIDLAHDGLGRLRTVTTFPLLPDTSQARVVTFAYDAQGKCAGPAPTGTPLRAGAPALGTP